MSQHIKTLDISGNVGDFITASIAIDKNTGKGKLVEQTGSLGDYIKKAGPIREGIDIRPNGLLTFETTGGSVTNLEALTLETTTTSILAKTPVTFRYLKPDESDESVDITSIDPTQYYNNGLLTLINTDLYTTFQKVYMNTVGDIRILRGTILYSDLDIASLRFQHEELTLVNGYFFIGGFLLQKNCIELATTRARVIKGSKFGEVGSNGTIGLNGSKNYVVDTVTEMEALAPSNNDVCVVSIGHRRGIFVYLVLKVANNNQGTNFNGWVRIYNGLVKLEWFIVDLNVDNSNVIITVMNAFGYISFNEDIVTGSILTSTLTGDIKFFGNKINKFISIGNNSFIDYDVNKPSHDLDIEDVVFDGFRDVVRVNAVAINTVIKEITLLNNTTINGREGFVIAVNFIHSARCHDNRFKDLISTTNCRGILLGTNDKATARNRGNYSVTGNIFDKLLSTGENTEVHAIALYGYKGTILDNHILHNRNLPASVTGAEGIYTKLEKGVIYGNHLTDSGYSNNGSIAIKGANTEEIGATTPAGNGVICFGNPIVFTDTTTLTGIGIFCQNEQAKILYNSIEGATDTSIVIATEGKFIDVTYNDITNNLGEIGIHYKANATASEISSNNIEMTGVTGLLATAMVLSAPVGGADMVKLKNNTTVAHKNFLGNGFRNIQIQTTVGRILNDIYIEDNTFNPTNSIGTVYDIFLAGDGIINNLNVINNKNTLRNNLGMVVGLDVVLNDTIVERNKWMKELTSGFRNLGWGDVDSLIIQDNGSVINGYDVVNAEEGKHYTFLNANVNGSIGVDVEGVGVFRDGSNRMNITGLGMVKIVCNQTGFWDVESASATVSFTTI